MEILVTCKKCGNEIRNSARVCPYCGKRQKYPILFISIIVIFAFVPVLALMQNAMEKPEQSSFDEYIKTIPEYAQYKDSEAKKSDITKIRESVTKTQSQPPLELTTETIIDALNENALKASKTYKDKRARLTGKLTSIDAQGKYIILSSTKDQYSLRTVKCYIDASHEDTVMQLRVGQMITVVGIITSVGEVIGYTFDVERIRIGNNSL